MDAAVTGGNGFLGRHLVRRLLARGDRVRCLVRNRGSAEAAALHGEGALLCEGDVTTPESLRSALEGAQVVFHLAGARSGTGEDAFMRVNAEGTRNVCRAMAAGHARRLVLASSLAASGPSRGGRPRREEDPLSPAEWYGQSKAEAERIAFSFRDRLEVTASRPVRIMGPGDAENLPFFRIVSRGWKLELTGPRRPVGFVDVADVVDHLLLLGERSEAVGEAFFCTAEDFSLAELQDAVAGALGVRTRRIPVPGAALLGAGALADGVSRLTGKTLRPSRKLARQLLAPGWICSGEKSARVLGFAPKRALRESIAETARWYREQGWL